MAKSKNLSQAWRKELRRKALIQLEEMLMGLRRQSLPDDSGEPRSVDAALCRAVAERGHDLVLAIMYALDDGAATKEEIEAMVVHG